MSAVSATPAILFTLSFEEARVLGCLIEKEITLPDYYPMTLNALVTACNQTTNRDPVVRYDERMVLLRGSQTGGELRQRTERLQAFPDMESVESTLAELIGYAEGPLVQCIPAGPGQRVAQYMHLLCGEVAGAPLETIIESTSAAPAQSQADDAEWRTRIESEITLLKAQVSRLQTLIGAVK